MEIGTDIVVILIVMGLLLLSVGAIAAFSKPGDGVFNMKESSLFEAKMISPRRVALCPFCLEKQKDNVLIKLHSNTNKPVECRNCGNEFVVRSMYQSWRDGFVYSTFPVED